jgi:electron transfer flavoprotein alpha subunit
MSVIIYAESENGKIKKSAFELASYGYEIASEMNVPLIAVTFNQDEVESLGTYGIEKVIKFKGPSISNFTALQYAENIASIAKENEAKVIILSSSANAKYLAPKLSINLSAGYASNVISLPEKLQPLTVKRSCFTNKAFNICSLSNEVNIIGLSNNSYEIKENPKSIEIIEKNSSLTETTLKVEKLEKSSGKVTIADADVVVSGGRGLKGPENWHLIEDLADTLGGATACSKPVSDMGWRPHSEHVGQTGKPVASNLYIAIGVSGAIQHLAGVNSSKVKVVINNDPEAPFFKAADYGIVGDAFEVIPQLTKKLKEFKNKH